MPSSWSLSCNYSLKISISKHPQILKLSLVSNTLKIPFHDYCDKDYKNAIEAIFSKEIETRFNRTTADFILLFFSMRHSMKCALNMIQKRIQSTDSNQKLRIVQGPYSARRYDFGII